jgi:trimeric autotransporter adhesin
MTRAAAFARLPVGIFGDASGNIGIGTATPLGTNAGRGNLTINGTTDAILALGIGGSLAGYILQDSGGMTINATGAVYQRFYTNGSERMRIDSAGNVGIGMTSPTYKLDVTSSSAIVGRVISSGSTQAFFAIRNSGGAQGYLSIDASNIYLGSTVGSTGNKFGVSLSAPDNAVTIDASGNLVLSAGSNAPAVNNGGEIALQATNNRIGYLAGDSSHLGYIQPYDASGFLNLYSTFASGGIRFFTGSSGGAERARIDYNGNLLVGTTTIGANSSHITVGGDSGTARVSPRTDNVGYVGDSGQRWQAVYAVNGTIQTSDGREKNTIEDSNLGLSFVTALRPVSYKWNVGENLVTYDENQQEIVTPRVGVRTHYGFIAQEVKAAIPEGVDFGGFVQEPNDGMMSLRYHEFIGPLVKAIQEQQAIIEGMAAKLKSAGIAGF